MKKGLHGGCPKSRIHRIRLGPRHPHSVSGVGVACHRRVTREYEFSSQEKEL